MLGWVAVGPEISRSPIKGKEGPRDVKVILGNKQMMADEGIPISKAVDDYMRDMEVCLQRTSQACPSLPSAFSFPACQSYRPVAGLHLP